MKTVASTHDGSSMIDVILAGENINCTSRAVTAVIELTKRATAHLKVRYLLIRGKSQSSGGYSITIGTVHRGLQRSSNGRRSRTVARMTIMRAGTAARYGSEHEENLAVSGF